MSEKKYDLHDNDLMTATEASLRWGYDSGYVRQMKKKYPYKIPEGEIRLFGKTLVITRDGMEALTGRKEPTQHFYVIEEDNWSVQSQKEVATLEEGKELLKEIILKNIEFVDLDQVTLKYIDPAKTKFGLSIKPGKRFYIESRK
ncbi:helix-turn-helix domain-containing protein [Enterococcus mundtii]|uniref:helix-turn-helix domain-containing protein n=1 Tax=Enterococcus mundtii TaxID=53346 RepID=UPI0032DF5A5F